MAPADLQGWRFRVQVVPAGLRISASAPRGGACRRSLGGIMRPVRGSGEPHHVALRMGDQVPNTVSPATRAQVSSYRPA
jgi:hypothetical protein